MILNQVFPSRAKISFICANVDGLVVKILKKLPFWLVNSIRVIEKAVKFKKTNCNKLISERLLLNHANTPVFLAPGGEEFNPGPETRLDRSELLCNKVLLKYKGDRESF